MHVFVVVVEGALLERGEVTVNGAVVALELCGDGAQLFPVGSGGLAVVGLELGDGLGDDVVAGGVEVEDGLTHRLFEFVGMEAVVVAAGFGAVAGAAPADVVAVAVVAAVGGGANVGASALRAADAPGEFVFGGVGGSLADIRAAFAEDVLGEVELFGGDDGGVCLRNDDVAEAFLAEVDPVGDDDFNRVR